MFHVSDACGSPVAVRGPAVPLRSAAEALEIVGLITDRASPTTVCLAVDDARWPISCIVLDHETTLDVPDRVLEIADRLADAFVAAPVVAAVVLATIRPSVAVEPADIDRLYELATCFDSASVELLEWIIVHRGTTTMMRALAGLAPLW
jgi:hypothetical protein